MAIATQFLLSLESDFFFSLVDITWARRGADRYVLYLHRLYYTRRPLDHMENRDPGAIPNDIWRDIVQLCRDKTAAEQRQYASSRYYAEGCRSQHCAEIRQSCGVY